MRIAVVEPRVARQRDVLVGRAGRRVQKVHVVEARAGRGLPRTQVGHDDPVASPAGGQHASELGVHLVDGVDGRPVWSERGLAGLAPGRGVEVADGNELRAVPGDALERAVAAAHVEAAGAQRARTGVDQPHLVALMDIHAAHAALVFDGDRDAVVRGEVGPVEGDPAVVRVPPDHQRLRPLRPGRIRRKGGTRRRQLGGPLLVAAAVEPHHVHVPAGIIRRIGQRAEIGRIAAIVGAPAHGVAASPGRPLRCCLRRCPGNRTQAERTSSRSRGCRCCREARRGPWCRFP